MGDHVLTAIVKMALPLDRRLGEILQILSITLFEKEPIQINVSERLPRTRTARDTQPIVFIQGVNEAVMVLYHHHSVLSPGRYFAGRMGMNLCNSVLIPSCRISAIGGPSVRNAIRPSACACALIVIDVQRFFINAHTAALPQRIAELIGTGQFPHVLFTKFVNHPDSQYVRQLGWHRCRFSPETDLAPPLVPFAHAENTFEKTSYSIFKARGLPEYLVAHGIRDLTLCGTDIDACILASGFEAFDLGYRVTVLREYSRSHHGRQFARAAGLIIANCFEGRFPT